MSYNLSILFGWLLASQFAAVHAGPALGTMLTVTSVVWRSTKRFERIRRQFLRLLASPFLPPFRYCRQVSSRQQQRGHKQLDELKSRKRLLRRLDFINDADVVQIGSTINHRHLFVGTPPPASVILTPPPEPPPGSDKNNNGDGNTVTGNPAETDESTSNSANYYFEGVQHYCFLPLRVLVLYHVELLFGGGLDNICRKTDFFIARRQGGFADQPRHAPFWLRPTPAPTPTAAAIGEAAAAALNPAAFAGPIAAAIDPAAFADRIGNAVADALAPVLEQLVPVARPTAEPRAETPAAEGNALEMQDIAEQDVTAGAALRQRIVSDQ
ncbi:hypothetical protein PG984_006891 [Apiospora sp. TS-2023a]